MRLRILQLGGCSAIESFGLAGGAMEIRQTVKALNYDFAGRRML